MASVPENAGVIVEPPAGAGCQADPAADRCHRRPSHHPVPHQRPASTTGT